MVWALDWTILRQHAETGGIAEELCHTVPSSTPSKALSPMLVTFVVLLFTQHRGKLARALTVIYLVRVIFHATEEVCRPQRLVAWMQACLVCLRSFTLQTSYRGAALPTLHTSLCLRLRLDQCGDLFLSRSPVGSPGRRE